MREYELTFVVQPEISEEGREALIAKLGGVLEKQGAAPLHVEDAGKRKLAYEIREFQKGHYLTLHFLDSGKCVTEVERALRLEESILRYLTVQIDDRVTDVPARKAFAVEQERIRKERAAERAAREAEERAAREAEERERAAALAAQAEAASEEPREEKVAEEPAGEDEEAAEEEAAGAEDEE